MKKIVLFILILANLTIDSLEKTKIMKKMPYLLLIIVLIINSLSCHKSNINKDCGCNSQTIQTINEWKGYLFFDNTQKKYEVQIGSPGGSANYFICDTTFPQLQSIIDTNRAITYNVIFSGNVKKFCVPDSIVAYISQMYDIELTNLTKQ